MPAYKLLTYQSGRGARAGLMVNDVIYDVESLTGEPSDVTVLSLLDDWQAAQERLDAAAASAGRKGEAIVHPALRAPILYPPAIYCAGANYKDHAEEMARMFNRPVEPDPHTKGLKCFFFMKTGRTATDPGAIVNISDYSETMDWEIELAVVIGQKATRVAEKDALEYVAGYTVANDLSARDFGRRDVIDTSPFRTDWLSSKNFNQSCPLGPWIVPAGQIKDPHGLAMTLTVNGVTKQESNTGRMIYNINEQIAHLSARITLYPCDVILTGTPAGVGVAQKEFLKSGDRVECWIERIGTLTNIMA
jgi:2-keto-4-pentenoate hydratase/2-oxohepta-3-ene-1,7-dioic acid hydratase in catechol pathway